MRHFPLTRFVIQASVSEQIEAITSEALELIAAFKDLEPVRTHDNRTDRARKTERLTEEAWDTLHAVETLLAMLVARGVDIEAVRAMVEEKNRARGYYEGCTWNGETWVSRDGIAIENEGGDET